MSILSRTVSRLTGMVRGAALPQPRPGSGLSNMLFWLSRFPVDANPVRTKHEQLSAYVGWANAAVNRIALDVRATPRTLWKKTGKGREDWDVVEDVPPILQRPNAMQTMGEFMYLTAMHLDLTGESYWHEITAGERAGKLLGIQSVYPHWVDEPRLDQVGNLQDWRVTIPGRSSYFIPAADMVFLKYPHPLDPLKGASPVEAYAITHDMDIYARAYGGSLLKNRATPELVISVKESLEPENAKLISERWQDRYRDPANGPAVLSNDAKVQQLGLSIKDLGFLELTNATREMILAIYSMPAAVLGLTTDFNRANADTAKATYAANCLKPRLDLIEEAFNVYVMPRLFPKESDKLWFGFEDPVDEDRDFVLRQADTAFKAGASTLNEYRAELGMDGVKDGDVYYMPMGVNVVSSVEGVTDEEPEPLVPLVPNDPAALPPPANDDKPDPAKPDPGQEEDPAKVAAERIMGKLEPLISNLPAVIKGPDSKALKMRAAKAEFLRSQERLERSLKSEVRKLFSKEQASLLKRLKQEGARSGFPAEMRARATAWKTRIADKLTRDWTEDEIAEHAEEWESTFREFILRGVREGWLIAAADLPQTIAWDLYRPEAEKFAREIAGLKVTQIQKTTLDGVRNIIGDGVASGATVDQMADDLRNLYDGFKGLRAEVISRTETATSVNAGKQDHADEVEERLGLKLLKTWVSVQDERTRESHVEADGQTVPNGEPFQIGSAFLDQPGDMMGPPEETIQCFPGETLVVAEGVKKAFRRWYDGDLVEITTASGHKLAGTPNHPILTRRGWQALGSLNEGDHVICRSLSQLSDVDTLSHPDVDDVPTTIREVFDALAEVPLAPKGVAGTGMDFHGDGSYGKVDIVFAERKLGDIGVPSGAQPGAKDVLPGSDLRKGAGFCDRHPLSSLRRRGPASRRGVSRTDLTSAALSVHGGPLQSFCLALAASGNSGHLEEARDDVAGKSEAIRNRFFGRAISVGRDDIGEDSRVFGVEPLPAGFAEASGLDAVSLECGIDEPKVHAENPANILQAFPFSVEPDSVVEVKRRRFAGHVYNLEVSQGYYIANGIVSHNCRCTLTYSAADE